MASENVKVEGSFKIFSFKNPRSGNNVSRWFCEVCGSQLMSQSGAHQERLSVRAGIFDEFAEWPITVEIFTDCRWSSLTPISGAEQRLEV